MSTLLLLELKRLSAEGIEKNTKMIFKKSQYNGARAGGFKRKNILQKPGCNLQRI